MSAKGLCHPPLLFAKGELLVRADLADPPGRRRSAQGPLWPRPGRRLLALCCPGMVPQGFGSRGLPLAINVSISHNIYFWIEQAPFLFWPLDGTSSKNFYHCGFIQPFSNRRQINCNLKLSNHPNPVADAGHVYRQPRRLPHRGEDADDGAEPGGVGKVVKS